jgi:dihydropteroate synthase
MTRLPDRSSLAASTRLYLRPAALHRGDEASRLIDGDVAFRLAGSRLACSLLEVILRHDRTDLASSYAAPAEVSGWGAQLPEPHAQRIETLLRRLSGDRPGFGGRPQIMGILNVTPDSFSDGGEHVDLEAAVDHSARLVEEGAQIIDVGGESTRPFAEPVPVEEELRRALPVVEKLAAAGITVSIDTRRAAVIRAATSAGASIINDVSGLTGDPESLEVAASSGARVVLMHMQGYPRTMQVNPTYDRAALDIFDWLEARIEACERAGIPRDRLIVDPGICFGKTEAHNLDLLRSLALFHGLGCPILLGVSRKGWTGWIEQRYRPKERLPSSLAAAQWGLDRGVGLLRVHDVAAICQALDAWLALTF